MAITDKKIEIITGINDIPSSTGEPNHPNGSLMVNKYNALIDEQNQINTGVNSSLSVLMPVMAGITIDTYSYDETTGNFIALNSPSNVLGEISGYLNNYDIAVTQFFIGNNQYAVAQTHTIPELGDFLMSSIGAYVFTPIDDLIGSFHVLFEYGDGTISGFARLIINIIAPISGSGGSGIDHITSQNNGDGTHTITYWGDGAETINLGSTTLVDGVSPQVVELTQSAYDALGTYDPNTFYVING